jgi:hypothetical protein
MVTVLHYFNTINPKFSESSPNKCEFLDIRGNMKKIIGHAS